MKTVNVHDAKTHLSRLLDQVALGEEIVLAKAGRPVARLVPVASATADRTPGSARGDVWVSEDFDAPLPPDVLDSFS
ncbi:MAG: type II toxin-antitoxin system Phd/YefM family antitoxin [Actinomycetota bacterium]